MLASQWRACRAVAAALLRLACCVACAAAAIAIAMNSSYGTALICLVAGLLLVYLDGAQFCAGFRAICLLNLAFLAWNLPCASALLLFWLGIPMYSIILSRLDGYV